MKKLNKTGAFFAFLLRNGSPVYSHGYSWSRVDVYELSWSRVYFLPFFMCSFSS